MVRWLAVTFTSALLLSACGGDDSAERKSPPKPSPTPVGIPEAAVNALPLGTGRARVEARFGTPLGDPRSRVPARVLRGEPKGTRCTYYAVEGGKDVDFFQLCFKGGRLASKLSLITPPKGAAASPVVPPVQPD